MNLNDAKQRPRTRRDGLTRRILIGLLLVSSACSAETYLIGATPILIDPPPGFARIDSSMALIGDFARHEAAPGEVQHAAYIQDWAVDLARSDAFGATDRWCSLQTRGEFVDESISPQLFDELKWQAYREERESALPGRRSLRDDLGEPGAGDVEDGGQGRTLLYRDSRLRQPHVDDERQFAYSSIVGSIRRDEKGMPSRSVGTQHTAFLRVKDRMLVLRVFGGDEDMHWGQDVLERWADAIILANTEAPARGDGSISRWIANIDWSEIPRRTFRVMVLVMLIGGMGGVGLAARGRR